MLNMPGPANSVQKSFQHVGGGSGRPPLENHQQVKSLFSKVDLFFAKIKDKKMNKSILKAISSFFSSILFFHSFHPKLFASMQRPRLPTR